jgi:hypothetical protein
MGGIIMPSSFLTELALRAAVNTNNRTLTNEKGQAEAIKDFALKRSAELIQSDASASTVDAQVDLQSQAIGLAVKCLEVAYTAISKQIDVLNDQRLSFDKERQAGIGTFLLPTNKEETSLSTEEKIMSGFLDLVNRNPSFATYLGIHSAECLTDSGSKFFSILPFYRMSEALGQPVASTHPLDRQRIAINLFFKSALPDAIADIEIGFQTDWKFIAFWESAFQRKNYLNNRRAPRLIMMGLSNLLWNLQHPVDAKTGLPLSLTRCIELCRDVEIFLNQLLNSESSISIKKISNDENNLLSFMRKLEIHTKILRAAYAHEQLHELNIDEITNSAHQALRIIDKSIFKLIYKRYHPVAQKEVPDEKAAEILAEMISYLNVLLLRNTKLINTFQDYPQWISSAPTLNQPPLTIIDVLIIFCHSSWREREHLLKKIEASNMDSALEFAQTLRKFDLKFVKPIKAVSKKELHATIFNPKHQEVGRLTGRRLVPLITLVINDYQVDLDTPIKHDRGGSSLKNQNPPPIYDGKQQVQAINQSADMQNTYYTWALSPFVTMSTKLAREIDTLPKRQYRLTQMTELLDSVSYLIKNYRNFLQNKIFQTFLLKCLNKAKEEFLALDQYIDTVDLYLAQDERMSRSLQATLRPMTKDLNTSLEAFSLAATNFEGIVNAPDFTDQLRPLLATKLTLISNQFSALFAEDSGITALIDAAPDANPVDRAPIEKEIVASNMAPTGIVETRKVMALRKLVQRCYIALSYQSREGHKGLLLRELSNFIENRPNFTEGQIKHVVMELTRITASYRETWLFQAAYGQTRSARALIAAIKDPNLNSVLPLASIIFEQPNINIMQVKDAQILEQLKNLREGNRWEESSGKIEITSNSS